MTDIYAQHDKAFSRVSAWVILDKSGERVATVAIKFPEDGAGRLWAYTHYIGELMTRQHADGYGYDKRTPAVCGGFLKARVPKVPVGDPYRALYEVRQDRLSKFQATLDPHSGTDWADQLRHGGFTVLQAV